MPLKLLLTVDAYTKFEVSSYSRSKDIKVHILMLDLTESEFLQFCYLLEATQMCRHVAVLLQHSRFSNPCTLATIFKQKFLRVRGPRCTGSVAIRGQTSVPYTFVLHF